MGNVAMRWGWRSPVGQSLAAWLTAVALTLAGFGASPVQAQGRAEYAPGNLEFRLPDKWSVETGKQKLTLVAPNEDGFIQFTLLQPGNDAMLRAQVAQALTTYLTDTVLADPGDTGTLNNMPSFRVSGTGASDATTVQFVAVAMTPAQATPVLVLAYASQDSFAAHAPVFEALIKSLKRR
jgi:hypothetical protein